jgi:Nitroreductase
MMKNLWPVLALALSLLVSSPALAEGEQTLKLPAPNREGGRPLMAVLSDRRSDREFKPEALSEQQIADILWAAVGVNRADGENHRTAPTARNRQDVEVYALTAKGAYLYDAIKHELRLVAEGDQSAVLGAPLGLAFVTPAGGKWAEANVGFSSQNVYLYAASEGLNTVVKGTFDQKALADLLKLPADKTVLLVQPVGLRP